MELDAFVEGTLLYIAVPEGTVAIDGIIAVIGQPGEDWQAAIKSTGDAVGTTILPTVNSAAEPIQQENIPAQIVSVSNDGQRIKASPLAKSMAKESGINLGQIQGSGEGGRIVRKDVIGVKPGEAIVPTVTKTVAAPTQVVSLQTSATESSYEDKTVSQMRKTIARRLSESKFTAPHFYLSVEIDMERAIQVREQLNQNSEVRISYNDLVIRSVASALKKHAVINASWLGDRIRYNHDVHIGVAVAVEDGLLVPVIKHADRKTLSQINGEVKMLAGKAKDKKLQPDEMQGNTFTISNLGMFGIDEFTAIINPPDACILAVGGIIQKPVVKNGQIVVGNTMKVTLSCDHRVVDGASGAQFLQTLKSILEEPLLLLK
jgi:pyruvate dehydrogenase E2 component (dihydrolipoamide acetyltransferase)